LIVEEENQGKKFKLFYLTFFLSTILSGVLVGITLSYNSIFRLVFTEALLLGIGGLILLTIPKPNPGKESQLQIVNQPLSHTLREIITRPIVLQAFIMVAASQAVFQGAYTTLISYLPLSHFQLGSAGVTSFQLAASLGIIGGFIIIWLFESLFKEARLLLPWRSISACLLATGCLFGIAFVHMKNYALLYFFGLNLIYECVWLYNQTEYFKSIPTHLIGRLQFILNAVASFLMSLFALFYAWMIEHYGFVSASFFYTFGGLLWFSLLFLVIQLPGWNRLKLRPEDSSS
jgi:hypothetical protein